MSRSRCQIQNSETTIMIACLFSGTEENMLAEDDDFEEEEMLKRAIAMSLEEH